MDTEVYDKADNKYRGGQHKSPESPKKKVSGQKYGDNMSTSLANQEESAAGQAAEQKNKTDQQPKSLEPGAVAQAERTPHGDEQSGGLYTGSKGKTPEKRRRKRAAVGVVVATVLVAFGIFFAAWLLPVAKFLQFAAVLSTFSMGHNDEQSSISTTMLLRYALAKGNLGETRMGTLGSAIFYDTRQQLASMGIDFADNKLFGNLGVIRFDPSNPNNPLHGMTTEDAKKELVRRLGAVGAKIKLSDIEIDDNGRLVINAREGGITSTRYLVKGSVAFLGKGSANSWLRTRIIRIYYGLASIFHPIKRATTKFQGFAASKLEAKKRAKEARAATVTISPTLTEADRKAMIDEKNSILTKITGTVLSGISFLCFVRNTADNAANINHYEYAVQGAAEAAHIASVGSQLRHPPAGYTLLDYSDAVRDLPDFSNSRAYNAVFDPYTTKGNVLDPEIAQGFDGNATANRLKTLGDDTPVVGSLLDSACSPTGQLVQVGVAGAFVIAQVPTGGGLLGFGVFAVSQGTQFLVGMVKGQAYTHVLERVLDGGPGIPEDLPDDQRTEALLRGAVKLGDITARAGGGVKLSKEESQAINDKIARAYQEEFRTKSTIAKLFDVTDHRTLLGSIIMRQNGEPVQQLANMATNLLNVRSLFSSIFSVFQAPIARAAGSAEPFDWGQRYGIPQRLLNNPAHADPYAVSEEAAKLFWGDDTYIKRARTCFGVEIARDSNGNWGAKPVEDVNPQSSEYEDAHCDNADPNWDKVILFVFHSTNMEAVACFQGKQESCIIITGTQQ